jgi:NADPH2:quinone reductase
VRAIQITEFGGPDKLTLTDLPEPTAGDEFVVIDVDAAGVNFADIHQISDTYLAPQRLPLVPGLEVVGRRRADGARVVALTSSGGYAETAIAHPSTVFEVPDEVDDGQALALVVQGATAWHLLRTSTRMQQGDSVVVHAAAGGVGSLAVQLATHWGAGRVIATASSDEKRELAVDLGADVAVDVSACESADDVTQLLLDAGDGAPADIVLEMTGGKVFDGSLAALAPFGRLATYGAASGTPPTPVQPVNLMHGSRTVAGFWLVDALRLPGGLRTAMEELLSLTASGRLQPVLGGRYALEDAAVAHQDLAARRTTGKLVLDVRPTNTGGSR